MLLVSLHDQVHYYAHVKSHSAYLAAVEQAGCSNSACTVNLLAGLSACVRNQDQDGNLTTCYAAILLGAGALMASAECGLQMHVRGAPREILSSHNQIPEVLGLSGVTANDDNALLQIRGRSWFAAYCLVATHHEPSVAQAY